ncbi:MAG: hypothetical protein KBE23_14240 [Chloroflexi bacterium]|nr:hypothetical protein [Chloroflexota bacterium]MBP7043901.1 hypothetical protein [Chloroflexota bacterium]
MAHHLHQPESSGSGQSAIIRAFKQAFWTFLAARVILTVWGVLVPMMIPAPLAPEMVLRPYLDQPYLDSGLSGLLLGPWQRFDTQRYLRIAQDGYAHEEDSVFPPLYPLAARSLGALFGGGPTANLLAATLISNAAFMGLLVLFYRVVAAEVGSRFAPRALVYLTFFPTGFFLLAPYSEALFILLALGSIWAARGHGRFLLAGFLGFFASLTRLTGWVLVVPLAYELYRQWPTLFPSATLRVKKLLQLFAILLPGAGTAVFLLWRWWAGLPPINQMYEQYWFQVTGLPGTDLLRALQTMFLGGTARAGEFTLWFDFFCAILLIIAAIAAFRRLNITYGLYSALLLLFMLLPASELKPLYSFSRYTLAFFPLFMLLALAGKNGWVHRLILYPSFVLYLYFSGQYFIWGWVA